MYCYCPVCYVLKNADKKNIKNTCNSGLHVVIFAAQTEEKGSVVQLVRMPPCHGGGRGFESRPVRKL
jgi:hypothetical protein